MISFSSILITPIPIQMCHVECSELNEIELWIGLQAATKNKATSKGTYCLRLTETVRVRLWFECVQHP